MYTYIYIIISCLLHFLYKDCVAVEVEEDCEGKPFGSTPVCPCDKVPTISQPRDKYGCLCDDPISDPGCCYLFQQNGKFINYMCRWVRKLGISALNLYVNVSRTGTTTACKLSWPSPSKDRCMSHKASYEKTKITYRQLVYNLCHILRTWYFNQCFLFTACEFRECPVGTPPGSHPNCPCPPQGQPGPPGPVNYDIYGCRCDLTSSYCCIPGQPGHPACFDGQPGESQQPGYPG